MSDPNKRVVYIQVFELFVQKECLKVTLAAELAAIVGHWWKIVDCDDIKAIVGVCRVAAQK